MKLAPSFQILHFSSYLSPRLYLSLPSLRAFLPASPCPSLSLLVSSSLFLSLSVSICLYLFLSVFTRLYPSLPVFSCLFPCFCFWLNSSCTLSCWKYHSVFYQHMSDEFRITFSVQKCAKRTSSLSLPVVPVSSHLFLSIPIFALSLPISSYISSSLPFSPYSTYDDSKRLFSIYT